MIARLFQDWLERLSHRLRSRARCPICGEKMGWGRCQTLIHVVGAGGILEAPEGVRLSGPPHEPAETPYWYDRPFQMWRGQAAEREDC